MNVLRCQAGISCSLLASGVADLPINLLKVSSFWKIIDFNCLNLQNLYCSEWLKKRIETKWSGNEISTRQIHWRRNIFVITAHICSVIGTNIIFSPQLNDFQQWNFYQRLATECAAQLWVKSPAEIDVDLARRATRHTDIQPLGDKEGIYF